MSRFEARFLPGFFLPGIWCSTHARAWNAECEKHGIELPISSGVQRVLHGEITPTDALRQLLAREQKPEYPVGLFG